MMILAARPSDLRTQREESILPTLLTNASGANGFGKRTPFGSHSE